MSTPTITVPDLALRYRGFLIDAYGVLVDASGALPGAADLLVRLRSAGKPFVVLSNDASRLPTTASSRYRGFGLDIAPDDLVTSGSLIAPYFERTGLRGQRCIVLGPPDAVTMVEEAGGRVVEPTADADVLVVCDDDGYPFLPTIEAALSSAVRRLDRGAPLRLLLPNPDLTYPKGGGEIGLASGSVAMVLEAALAVRYGAAAPRFDVLGKPHRPIFEAGCARLGLAPDDGVVMIGDQLGTDIAGARAFGIDAVLVATGLGRADAADRTRPTWLLPSLQAP